MKLSVLQLNLNGDTFWEQQLAFFAAHDFDVIQLQEVTGKGTHIGIVDSTRDGFTELTNAFKDRYVGEIIKTDTFTSSPTSYMGNATFYKKTLSLVDTHIEWLKKNDEPFSSDAISYEGVGRAILHLTLSKDGKQISFLNVHGAWGKNPEEHEHQKQQGEKIVEYVKRVPTPFVLSGDFNLNPQQPTIQHLGEISQNLTSEYGVTNTLNPRKHYATHLFPPGVAVDYIFVSNDLRVQSFRALDEEDISDHLGLAAEFEL
jgi:endonuclease/exonuclease/phosphatase family metal-dependent hydrolase